MRSNFCQLFLLLALPLLLSAQTCPLGQYISSLNQCQPCLSNCALCSSAQYCTSCRQNTFLVSSTFSISCQPCGIVLSGCSICLTNIACQTCAIGYYLTANNRCSYCSTGISNCANCNQNGTVCQQCLYPYVLVDNVCVSATVNVITGGIGENLGNGGRSVMLPNGTVVEAVKDSNGCNQLEDYVEGKCVRRIFQCLSYQNNNLCRTCHNGYIVTIFGDCAPNTTVLRCQNGFWFNSTSNTCQKVSQACDYFYPNNGSCFNCSSNYSKNTQNQCVPNRNCTSRQFFSQGQCISVPLACLSFLSNGTCTQCAAGNTLTDGVCVLSITTVTYNDCVFPCRTCYYQQLNYCFSCRFGYQLANAQYGSCVPVLY